MSILDLSKSLMYDVKTKYEDKAKLLFTDTDTLAYEIKTKDFYKDINQDIDKRFDTIDQPTNHPPGIKTVIKKVKCLECLRMKLAEADC